MTVTLLLELCVTPEKFMCNEFRLNLCKVKKNRLNIPRYVVRWPHIDLFI